MTSEIPHSIMLANGQTQPSNTFDQQHEVYNQLYDRLGARMDDPEQDFMDRVIEDPLTGEPRVSFSLGSQHPDFGNGTGL